MLSLKECKYSNIKRKEVEIKLNIYITKLKLEQVLKFT